MKLNQLFSQVAVKEFYIMAINPNELNNLLHKPFDVANSKNIATYILQLMGLSDFQFIYTQNTLKKITDTTKKGMFVDDTEFADRKSAFDILNNQYNINSKHQQIILPRLFVIKQYSRSNVIWLNKLGINYEDDPLINGFYPLGLDFVVCQGRFLVVISNQDNLRVLELNHAQELNSTQIEILSQWQALFTSESNKKLLHTHLWNSLNLESVNKKFYIDIIQNFANLKQHLTNNNHFDNNQAVIFTNRLIGRLLFCYFLIKKDFIPTEYLELDQQNDNEYYHNKLSQLFFAVLNTPINERSHEDRTTPYLNGGLFERKDTDIANVTFPDNYFSNLFAIFRKYNWTVDESLSNYEVMAIDPEMLGRIFENLLAEINVDNDGSSESARKAKGAFYTPRVIVDYMCKESLRQYLLTNSSEHSHSIINRLLDDSIGYLTDQKRNWTDDIKPYKEQLTNLLDKITVFDPACGSGAFPIGMLQLILHTYERLGDKQKPSNRKIKIIENSIFGADIEPNAIEISRLRAWLSIVVDEDKQDIEPLPNLDFKFVCCNSLIKLETKGQSNLSDNIGTVEKLQELQHKYFRARTYKSKQDIRQQYSELIEQSRSQNSLFGKSKYLEQIESYHPFDTKNVCQFYDNQFMFGISDGFDVVIGNPPYVGEKGHKEIFQKIKSYEWGNTYYKGKMDLFYFFFHLGIDAIKNNGSLIYITTNYFITADGALKLRQDFKNRTNISELINFNGAKIFESALGQHNMITRLVKSQNKLYSTKVVIANQSLQYKLDNSSVLQLMCGDKKFSATYHINGIDLYDGDRSYIRMSEITQEKSVFNILNKIKENGYSLGDKFHVNQGVISGADKVSPKHIKEYPQENYIKGSGIFINEKQSCNFSDDLELIKPFFKNSDIKQFYTSIDTDEVIFYLSNSDVLNSNSKIYQYLLPYKSILQDRIEFKSGNRAWHLLHRAREEQIFTLPKIVAPQRSPINTFAYNEIPWFASADVYFITAPDLEINQAKYELKYILALLNSKLYYHWFYHMGKRKGESLELYATPLAETVIYDAMKPQKDEFVSLVDEVLMITQQDDYIKDGLKQERVKLLQKQIDKLVYELYELTTEEIALIESN